VNSARLGSDWCSGLLEFLSNLTILTTGLKPAEELIFGVCFTLRCCQLMRLRGVELVAVVANDVVGAVGEGIVASILRHCSRNDLRR
jgi:hypothetical protein